MHGPCLPDAPHRRAAQAAARAARCRMHETTVQIAMTTDGSNADSSDLCRRPSASNARSPTLDREAEILAFRDDAHRHVALAVRLDGAPADGERRSEEHTSELQSPCNLVCRLLLEKKKNINSFSAL